MTKPDTLDRTIRGLKDLQRLAWERLADPTLTAFERCELRSQLKQSAAELRECLVAISEHTRFHERLPTDIGNNRGRTGFRLFKDSSDDGVPDLQHEHNSAAPLPRSEVRGHIRG
jgi:hypothetical protein